MNNPEKLATFGTQDEDKQNKIQHNMCWTPLWANNINKTRALPQTGGKDEPNIVFMRKQQRTSQHGTQNTKTISRYKGQKQAGIINNKEPINHRKFGSKI